METTTLNYAGARLRDPSALYRTHRRSSRQYDHTSFRAWWFRHVLLLWVVLLDVLNQHPQTDENTFQDESMASTEPVSFLSLGMYIDQSAG
ncbi:MAG TPA: hypothetical protein PL002_15560, partial [Flavobacteriales bacterium]|nr:hypothetical protein [Flavobacteriales bacterium]HNK42603.1 hypothetical protein [Flavobacteriales bacterium]